jgi:hypothetical protein
MLVNAQMRSGLRFISVKTPKKGPEHLRRNVRLAGKVVDRE